MKLSYLVLPLIVSGCVNLEFPGLVSDTAKLGKDAYGAIVGKKDSKEPGAQEPAIQESAKPPQETAIPAANPSEYITNAYIGQENQSIAEIKQNCVSEAAEKLFKLAGNDARYTVVENTIATVNNNVVANCRLSMDKSAVESAVVKK
ncbi:MAG: hypothetical protein Q7U91_05195 [Sideroxyarcus sp.]|nr:hypothetical protein [Sideroxyarcus sp.]